MHIGVNTLAQALAYPLSAFLFTASDDKCSGKRFA